MGAYGSSSIWCQPEFEANSWMQVVCSRPTGGRGESEARKGILWEEWVTGFACFCMRTLGFKVLCGGNPRRYRVHGLKVSSVITVWVVLPGLPSKSLMLCGWHIEVTQWLLEERMNMLANTFNVIHHR